VPVAAPSDDALLQASRRLDWRFLLAEPELGQVACFGSHDPALVESLRLFSAGFTASEAVPDSVERDSHDLVVLRNPTSEDLGAAPRLLRPGGWLYVEVDGPLTRGPGRLRSARAYARALRRLGLVEVGAYMHWPDFDSCRAIVSLDDAVAVRHALARGPQGGRARFRMRLAPLLAGAHMLALAVPSASAVGRRAVSGEEDSR
jgi:hypothetical protein